MCYSICESSVCVSSIHISCICVSSIYISCICVSSICVSSICVTASKRDGGVLSEQDIATWVEELVTIIYNISWYLLSFIKVGICLL